MGSLQETAEEGRGEEGREGLNITEGFRRLAVVAGLVGAAFGSIGSYGVIQEHSIIAGRYAEFLRLSETLTVRTLRANHQNWGKTVSVPDWFERNAKVPPGYVLDQPDPPTTLPADFFDRKAFDVEHARRSGWSEDQVLAKLTRTRKFDVSGALSAGYSKAEVIAYLSGGAMPGRRDGEIRSVRLSRDGSVEEIETRSEHYRSSDRPNHAAYLLVPVIPAAFFLVGWGGVRTIGWILGGFTRS